MTIVAYPPSVHMQPGDLDVDLKLQDLPLAVFALSEIEKGVEAPAREVAHIDGHLRLEGPTNRPHGDASLSVSFPDWPKLAAYRMAIEGLLTNGGGDHSTAVVDSGIEATLLLTRGDTQVLQGTLRYTAGLSLLPFQLRSARDGFWFEVNSDSLMLAEFDPLVPVDVSLGGTLTLNLTGSGDISDPELDGQLQATRLMVAVAQRARATANARIDLSGPLSAPSVEGNVEIIQGIIQIPDLPPNLHPVEGESLLLGDSLSGSPNGIATTSTSEPVATTARKMKAHFDVGVKIPDSFFIRGKGLDLELAGDLRLLKVEDAPEVIGELRAIRARLDLLGRRLTLEEGSVSFKGGDEINPELSVTLQTQIEDTRVRILFGGTAQEPKVFFSSEPELEEGDIMALLLFGRPLNQLDDDQGDHMQKRTAEVVMALGAAQLQEQTSQIGVDVIVFKAGDEEDSLGAFSFGRYLNPQVLLSYVRSLDDADDSYVSLEYFLRGRFKIQSVYGRRQSGVGIGWGKDY